MDAEERAALGHEAIDALIHTLRLHHRVVEKRIDGLGVHHSQHRMLMRLAKMSRSASQKDIAAAMDVSPACVARTLKHLEAAGLVQKSEGADGRCNEVCILPRGSRLVEDSLAIFRQIDAQMFCDVSGEEMAALVGLLRRVQDNLGRMEKSDAGGEPRGEGSV